MQRKHISTKPLHLQPDRLRDLVEKLLSIFCTDPLAEPPAAARGGPEEANVVATPGQKGLRVPVSSQHGGGSPFDLPSGNRALPAGSKKDEVVHTGSPVNRRKVKGEQNQGG